LADGVGVAGFLVWHTEVSQNGKQLCRRSTNATTTVSVGMISLSEIRIADDALEALLSRIEKNDHGSLL